MIRKIVLPLVLFPLAAAAQISTSQKPIFQGHNGPDWVATYGCNGKPDETSELISALKKALAENSQAAVLKGIQQARADYPRCVIGTSTNWQKSASYPGAGG